MRKSFLIAVLCIGVLLLAACQTSSTLLTAQPEEGLVTTQPETATQPVITISPESLMTTPEVGKTSLSGKVVDQRSGEPVANVSVRLADVYREGGEGAYVLDGAFSPGDITDDEGIFLIENVDAKEYVIIVGDVLDQHEVITNEDGTPRVWNLVPGDVFEVPTLEVDLPSR